MVFSCVCGTKIESHGIGRHYCPNCTQKCEGCGFQPASRVVIDGGQEGLSSCYQKWHYDIVVKQHGKERVHILCAKCARYDVPFSYVQFGSLLPAWRRRR